jgi:tricorn protease
MNRLIPLLLLATLVSPLDASEPIRFARTPDISPDGKLVVFSYVGDLWVVDARGGPARHLTMHEKHDYNPVFSPDGKSIAFSSNRHGSYDVYVMPVEGGRPRRITYDWADDHVTAWTPDSQSILFASGRSTAFPLGPELYLVPARGGQARQVSAFEGRDGVFAPDGKTIAYVRGPGTWYRKGYRGSSNDDIWVMNADGPTWSARKSIRRTQRRGPESRPSGSPTRRKNASDALASAPTANGWSSSAAPTSGSTRSRIA